LLRLDGATSFAVPIVLSLSFHEAIKLARPYKPPTAYLEDTEPQSFPAEEGGS